MISMNIDGSKKETTSEIEPDNVDKEDGYQQIDIMAQQLKFVACLKILMEELSTLATGFEVDGTQFFLPSGITGLFVKINVARSFQQGFSCVFNVVFLLTNRSF